ncbi:MAG: hypothetical protein HQK51_20600, partial [Oligoflexia bacterium]|nr:hypothetical protein [Oligoflexia bacterium]
MITKVFFFFVFVQLLVINVFANDLNRAKRPSGLIYVDNNYCACTEGVPVIINNCAAFCSERNDSAPTLYVHTTLDPKIIKKGFKTLFEWCNKSTASEINPFCQLELYDGTQTTYIHVSISSDNSNNFVANIAPLTINKTYVATLVEVGSGSMARTKSFQIKRIAPNPNLGLLRITPIDAYTCIGRAGSSSSSDFDLAWKSYYFYDVANFPPTIPAGSNIFCHDVNKYGPNDNPAFPRLELQEQIFNLWSQSDTRFFADVNNNNKLFINEYIQNHLLVDYGISANINIFSNLSWFNAPSISNITEPVTIGYKLDPFIDSVTNLSYCPKQEQYHSNDPISQILGNLIGVDTEGLYMAVSEPVKLTDQNGNIVTAPINYLLIREGLLKKIWFYYNINETPVTPDDNTVSQHTTMFNWPADINSPLIKKSNQFTYIVRHPSQLNFPGNVNIPPVGIPYDKRFACIPVTE